MMLGSAVRRKARLLSRVIIFEVFQPMSCDHIITVRQRHRRTDGCDGRTTCRSNTTLCVASRGKISTDKYCTSNNLLSRIVESCYYNTHCGE